MESKIKNNVTGIKKENLFLTRYSRYKPALEEAKNNARIFIIYFENNILKMKQKN